MLVAQKRFVGCLEDSEYGLLVVHMLITEKKTDMICINVLKINLQHFLMANFLCAKIKIGTSVLIWCSVLSTNNYLLAVK